MKRKLVQLGTNTLMISLPAKWLHANNLKKGDEIEVTESKDSITLTGKGEKEKKEITIEYDIKKGLYRRMFLLPYIRGYDKIIIKYNDPSVVDFIEKNQFILTGFEIVNQSKDSLTLQTIAQIGDENFDKVYERLTNIVISMLTEIKNGFTTGGFKQLDQATKFENLVNKLNFYCRRILNIHGYEKKELTTAIYTIVQNLEYLCDILRDTIKEMPKKELEQDNKAAESIGILIEIIKLNHKLFQKHDNTTATQVAKKEREYLASVKKIEKKILSRYLLSAYYPVHHISEEVLYAKL